MPTCRGLEGIVTQLLASTKPILLAKLGLQNRDALTLEKMSAGSFVPIIADRLAGSGKTSSLHSMPPELNKDKGQMWIAEVTIEITQRVLLRVRVNPKMLLTFAATVESFLRADLDLVMIGKVWADETVKIDIEALLTDHLV